MTDNDIIKALEYCASSKTSDACKGCPLLRDNGSCRDDGLLLYESALEIINRQKAEITDLKAKKKICAEVIARQDKEIENLSKAVDNYESCLRSVEVIRANAIKEFADRLKRRHLRLRPCFGVVRCCLSETDIDSLVKEMTEGRHEED